MKVDSRKVIKNDTFIALNGVNNDGHKYILDAIKNGANKIIVEKNKFNLKIKYVNNTRKYLEKKLDKMYKKKMNMIKLIGITGTNGKTTSSFFTYQLLNKLNIKCAYIGTIGFYIDSKIKDLSNTTPDIFDLYEMIELSIKNGCKVVVMEVSSQALYYKRIGKLKFDIGVFTNLTEEHLDFHKTMDNYLNTKLILFNNLKKSKLAIINSDSEYYKYFMNKKNTNILYGINGTYKISNFDLSINNSKFDLTYKNKTYNISIHVPNIYNIYNYLVSLIICNKLGIDISNIIDASKYLSTPKGRFEIINYKKNNIIIDYAHTPDGVLNVFLNTLKYKKNNVYTIIGCGGNRDTLKRGKIGYICCKYSNKVIFTNDNPRYEDENKIIKDIIKDLKYNNYEVILDRKKAIEKGISFLKKNDILLILGKGHEEYQIIKDKKIYFSDYKVVKELTK